MLMLKFWFLRVLTSKSHKVPMTFQKMKNQKRKNEVLLRIYNAKFKKSAVGIQLKRLKIQDF
ncbi:hypothetical protein B9T35_17065 [Acinetobacter sp. ANC 3832]|nr:hypothetical protein B9T35_17065 [Acinetobacter sp. ANC 3832]